jgi:hypothetical protein
MNKMKKLLASVLSAALVAVLACNTALAGRGCDNKAKTAEPAKAVASTAAADDVSISKQAPLSPMQIAAARTPASARPAGSLDLVCDQCAKRKSATAAVAKTQINEDLKFVQNLRVNRKSIDAKLDKTVIVKNVHSGPIGRLLGLDKPSVKENDRLVVRN